MTSIQQMSLRCAQAVFHTTNVIVSAARALLENDLFTLLSQRLWLGDL